MYKSRRLAKFIVEDTVIPIEQEITDIIVGDLSFEILGMVSNRRPGD